MMQFIFFLFFLNLGAVDNSQYDAQYPAPNTIIHFYPIDKYGFFSDKKFNPLPCITLKGEMKYPLEKNGMIRLDSKITTKSVFLESRKLFLTVSIGRDVIDHIWYAFSDNPQKALQRKVKCYSFILDDPMTTLHCADIDLVSENIFLGTDDGKILVYSTQDHKIKNRYDVSKDAIQGIWLFGEEKSMMAFATEEYLHIQDQNDRKPRVRIKKPAAFRTAYLDTNKIRKFVFSHAKLLPVVGLMVYTAWDSDYVAPIPTFYASAEGLSDDHITFLDTLRSLDSKCQRLIELKNTLKNALYVNEEVKKLAPQIAEYRKELIGKKHTGLFEDMVAEVFDQCLTTHQY